MQCLRAYVAAAVMIALAPDLSTQAPTECSRGLQRRELTKSKHDA